MQLLKDESSSFQTKPNQAGLVDDLFVPHCARVLVYLIKSASRNKVTSNYLESYGLKLHCSGQWQSFDANEALKSLREAC